MWLQIEDSIRIKEIGKFLLQKLRQSFCVSYGCEGNAGMVFDWVIDFENNYEGEMDA